MAGKMNVRLGLSLSNRAPLFNFGTIEEIMEAAVSAEQSGIFDSVWLEDSLVKGPRLESEEPTKLSNRP